MQKIYASCTIVHNPGEDSVIVSTGANSLISVTFEEIEKHLKIFIMLHGRKLEQKMEIIGTDSENTPASLFVSASDLFDFLKNAHYNNLSESDKILQNNKTDEQLIDELIFTHEITSTDLMNAAINAERGINNAETRMYRNIRNAADIFASKCYPSIVKLNDASSERGFSFEKDGKKILTYYLAARIMVTLSDNNHNKCTVVGADKNAGLHTVHGNPDEILDLLEYFTANWSSVKLIPNKEVEII